MYISKTQIQAPFRSSTMYIYIYISLVCIDSCRNYIGFILYVVVYIYNLNTIHKKPDRQIDIIIKTSNIYKLHRKLSCTQRFDYKQSRRKNKCIGKFDNL